MNRGSSTAVGCIHFAPFVAGSYTVSYVVGVLELNRLYRSRPTFAFVLPNRRTFAKRMSTTLMRSPYTAPGSTRFTSWVANPGASGRPVAARNCAAVMRKVAGRDAPLVPTAIMLGCALACERKMALTRTSTLGTV